MTPKQTAKFLRSEEFAKLTSIEYPYGLDESKDSDWEIITLVENYRNEKRVAWLAITEKANAEGWNDTPERLVEFHRVASAENNAADMIAEGHHAADTGAYYAACLTTLEFLRNDV